MTPLDHPRSPIRHSKPPCACPHESWFLTLCSHLLRYARPIDSSTHTRTTEMDPTDFNLTGRGADLFTKIIAEHEVAPHELAILVDACRTLNLIDRLERELDGADTMILGSMKQWIANPLFGELRQQRLAFASLMARLRIPEEDDGDQFAAARSQMARQAARARWGSGRA